MLVSVGLTASRILWFNFRKGADTCAKFYASRAFGCFEWAGDGGYVASACYSGGY